MRLLSWSTKAPPLATAHIFNCVTHLFCEASLYRLVLLCLCPWMINLYGVLTKAVIKGFVMVLHCIHKLRVWKPCQLSKLEEWKVWGAVGLANRHSNDLTDDAALIHNQLTHHHKRSTGRWEMKYFIGMDLSCQKRKLLQ